MRPSAQSVEKSDPSFHFLLHICMVTTLRPSDQSSTVDAYLPARRTA